MIKQTPATPAKETTPKRSAWTKPQLDCIPAQSAELGANPISPEGAFGTGS
jgi:hypothetical protein